MGKNNIYGVKNKMEKIKKDKLKSCIGSLGTAFIIPLILLVILGAIQSREYSIMGVIFICWAPVFLITALQDYMQYRQLEHSICLREIGNYVQASIDLVMREHTHGTFSVRCRRIESKEGEREYYTSEVYDARVYPFRIKVGDIVPVYVNPEDADDYFVDIVGE